MKKLAIIELSNHQEIVLDFIRLSRETHLIVYLTQTLFEDLQDVVIPRRIDWQVAENLDALKKKIIDNPFPLQGADFICLVTIDNHISFFIKFLNKYKKMLPPTVALVHNVHYLMNSKQSVWLWGKGLVFFENVLKWLLKHHLDRHAQNCSQLLQQLDYLAGLSTEMSLRLKKYISKEKVFKLAEYLPVPIVEVDSGGRWNAETFRIGLPGTLFSLHKDYGPLLKAIRSLKKRKDPFSVEFYFLGKPKTKKDENWIREFQNEMAPCFKVHYFKTYLSQKKYEALMMSMDFLILPLKPYVPFGIYKEEMGFSKISGGLRDVFRYGIPAILPRFYPQNIEIAPLLKTYQSNKELVMQINEFLSTREFEQIKQLWREKSQWRKAKQEECFKAWIDGMIERRLS